MNHRNNQKKGYNIPLLILLIILIVIVVVLTFGWFYRKKKEQEEEAQEKKKQRLKEMEALILVLQAKKEKIERTEKIIKLSVRSGIGLLLIAVNYLYARHAITSFEFDAIAGKLLNLNACIISVYTFIAFISYGSIESFVSRMKEILSAVLRKSHLNSLEELDSLQKERDKLRKDLGLD